MHKQKKFTEKKKKLLLDYFGVNCLKASTDKVKQPNWDFIKKMGATTKNGILEASPVFILVNFDMKLYVEALAGFNMQVQELLLTFKVK